MAENVSEVLPESETPSIKEPDLTLLTSPEVPVTAAEENAADQGPNESITESCGNNLEQNGLPEGFSTMDLPSDSNLMIGDDGEHYVTIKQGEQVYAIPIKQYQAMQLASQSPTAPAQATAHATAYALPKQTNQQNVIVPKAPEPVLTDLRPLKVDNWGMFILNRLQTFFQNRGGCGLTLKFPKQNSQIKVHSLVVNACTNFFKQLPGYQPGSTVEMPSDIMPENMAPIIKFMYTGRLEIKSSSNFVQLRDMVSRLKMDVLLKLMDAHSCQKPPDENTRKRKIRNDPVSQVKRIKRVEKKFKAMERQEKIMAAKPANSLPGKKLPIWKQRTTAPTEIPSPPKPPKVAQSAPKPVSYDDVKNMVPAGKSYKKIKEELTEYEKEREKQQSATFEKVRTSNPDSKDMSLEEMKEFMDEQRKRLALAEGHDDDDYFDNDAEVGYDDYQEEEQEQPVTEPAKSILKPSPAPTKETTEAQPTPRKSVRFSLRPGVKPVETSSNARVSKPATKVVATRQSPRRGEPVKSPQNIPEPPKTSQADIRRDKDIIDSTVEDFSREIEGSSETSKAKTATKPAKQPRRFPSAPRQRRSSNAKMEAAKRDIVAEILKRNPNLLKDQKEVKLKVMVKDPNGKAKMQTLVLKTKGSVADEKKIDGKSPDVPNQSLVCPPQSVNTYPNSDNVRIYTGAKGRPKSYKMSTLDDINVNNDDGALKTLDEVKGQDETEYIINDDANAQLDLKDPSSEAEALTNVASGIATSLGLVSSPEHSTVHSEELRPSLIQ